MPNLKQTTPYDGFKKSYHGLTIEENSGFEIISIAIASSEEKAAMKELKTYLGKALPAPSRMVIGKNGTLVWTAPGQYFLMSDKENDRLDEELAEQFNGLAYFTLQTDGWACLSVSGNAVHDVLERFIPLDLRAAPKEYAARSTAHHMGVMVLKTADDSYTLLTARSSSRTFLHALEDVVENVLGM